MERHRRKGRRMPAVATKRVVVAFPEPLLKSTEEAATQLSTNRSNLIRSAVEEFLKTLRRRKLEADLAAACEANVDLGREISEEFAFVDAENI